MIKHLVLWKLKPEIKNAEFPEKLALLQGMFDRMIGIVEGLRHVELYEINQPSEYDLCLYTEFDDQASLDAYKPHPLHQNVKSVSKDWVYNKLVIDYTVPDRQ
ncbi:MAG: Dabb family protein [Lachnospiraceae bacterium]|nr:Dabb family protein [Lachnospiraceae bacterium]